MHSDVFSHMGANRCQPQRTQTQGCPLSAGDAILVLASDGLLQAATPDEVCALAQALARGMPLPKPLAAPPVAIPLGPAASAYPPSRQPLVAPSRAGTCTGPRQRTALRCSCPSVPCQYRCRRTQRDRAVLVLTGLAIDQHFFHPEL